MHLLTLVLCHQFLLRIWYLKGKAAAIHAARHCLCSIILRGHSQHWEAPPSAYTTTLLCWSAQTKAPVPALILKLNFCLTPLVIHLRFPPEQRTGFYGCFMKWTNVVLVEVKVRQRAVCLGSKKINTCESRQIWLASWHPASGRYITTGSTKQKTILYLELEIDFSGLETDPIITDSARMSFDNLK